MQKRTRAAPLLFDWPMLAFRPAVFFFGNMPPQHAAEPRDSPLPTSSPPRWRGGDRVWVAFGLGLGRRAQHVNIYIILYIYSAGDPEINPQKFVDFYVDGCCYASFI